jgi:transposase InsO family protein
MLTSLHKQATTTQKTRAAIQASTEPAWAIAERCRVSEQMVWKWRNLNDLSHTPHRLPMTWTSAQQAVAVALRKTLFLPLGDLLTVVREFFNPHVSRSGLDRCLRCHDVGNLQAPKAKEPKPAQGTFMADEPGHPHIEILYLPQMADEDRRRNDLLAIDRATRWVIARIYPVQAAANARWFLRDIERAAPMTITCVLTDNWKAFTARLFGLRKRAATGLREFDLLCAELGLEHRLAPPIRPQPNGLVGRFNGRIEDVQQGDSFHSGGNPEQTILHYVHPCYSQLSQSVLQGRKSIADFKEWRHQRPELSRKHIYDHAGRDTFELVGGDGKERRFPRRSASRSGTGAHNTYTSLWCCDNERLVVVCKN